MTTCSASEVTVRRRARDVLVEVSVEIRAGRVVALLGENGAGKSTLLSVFAGLVEPTAGVARVGGRDIRSMGPMERARAVAWLPSTPPAPFGLNASEVVSLGLYASEHTRQAIVAGALASLELGGFERRLVTELSSGERQRVGLARIVSQVRAATGPLPRFALLDEPTSALDVRHQLLVAALLRRLALEGVGVVAAIHDVALALEVADDVLVLKAGRVAFFGPAAECGAEVLASAFSVRFAEERRLVARARNNDQVDNCATIDSTQAPLPRCS